MKLDYLKSIYRLYEEPRVPASERLKMYHDMTGGMLSYCSKSIIDRRKVNKLTSRYMPIIRDCLITIREIEAEDDRRAALGISEEDEDMIESIETDDDQTTVKQEEDTVAIKQEDTTDPDIKMEDTPDHEIKRERSTTVEIKRERSTTVRIKREPSDD